MRFTPDDAAPFVPTHNLKPALHAGDYADEELATWAGRVRGWMRGRTARDVYVYFDNDAKAHEAHNAMQLADLVGAHAPSDC